ALLEVERAVVARVAELVQPAEPFDRGRSGRRSRRRRAGALRDLLGEAAAVERILAAKRWLAGRVLGRRLRLVAVGVLRIGVPGERREVVRLELLLPLGQVALFSAVLEARVELAPGALRRQLPARGGTARTATGLTQPAAAVEAAGSVRESGGIDGPAETGVHRRPQQLDEAAVHLHDRLQRVGAQVLVPRDRLLHLLAHQLEGRVAAPLGEELLAVAHAQ